MSPQPATQQGVAGLPPSVKGADEVSVGHRQPQPLLMSQLTVSFWKLTFSIAAGIWLGCLAVAATAWLAWSELPPAVIHLAAPTQTAPIAPPAPRNKEEMFQQYLQRQQAAQDQQNQQVERTEQEKRFNSAPCQFWLQQYQANPTQGNREKMDGYCG